MRFLKLAIVLMFCGATPLEARDWANAGGWDIAEVNAEACAMGLEYEGKGETLLLLILDTKGEVILSVTNYAWTAVPDQEYKLDFYLNRTAFGGGKSFGTAGSGRKGFLTFFEPGFLKHFAASNYLTIRSDKGVLIDDLKLDGSAAGLAQLRRCLAHLKAVASAAAREKAKFAHIPDDPFAQLRGEVPPKPGQPVPIGSIAGLITRDDYPATAMEKNEQGRVSFRLAVAPTGRVVGCHVLTSSGSAALDSATCSVLTRRARFKPARAANGNATSGTYDGAVSWSLVDPVRDPVTQQ